MGVRQVTISESMWDRVQEARVKERITTKAFLERALEFYFLAKHTEAPGRGQRRVSAVEWDGTGLGLDLGLVEDGRRGVESGGRRGRSGLASGEDVGAQDPEVDPPVESQGPDGWGSAEWPTVESGPMVAVGGLTSGETRHASLAGEPSDVAPPSEPLPNLIEIDPLIPPGSPSKLVMDAMLGRGEPIQMTVTDGPCSGGWIDPSGHGVQIAADNSSDFDEACRLFEQHRALPMSGAEAAELVVKRFQQTGRRVQIRLTEPGAPAAPGDVSKPDERSDTGPTESSPVRPVDSFEAMEERMSVSVPFGASFEEHAASVQEALAKRELKIDLPKKTDEDLF